MNFSRRIDFAILKSAISQDLTFANFLKPCTTNQLNLKILFFHNTDFCPPIPHPQNRPASCLHVNGALTGTFNDILIRTLRIFLFVNGIYFFVEFDMYMYMAFQAGKK